MSGKIVTVFNEKGGAGKTTLACQLAGALGLRGYDVVIADFDPQQTSSRWISNREDGAFPATLWPGHVWSDPEKQRGIPAEMERLVKKNDIVIADCAPSVSQPATWAMLLVSDLGLIPTKLNAPDIDALQAAKAMARRAFEVLRRTFPVFVVPNAARMHLNDSKAAAALLAQDKEIPPIGVALGDRTVFSRSMLVGGTVHDLANADEAVREIEALADAVLKQLQLPKRASKKKERT